MTTRIERTEVYRDATYTAATQADLRRLEQWLMFDAVPYKDAAVFLPALRDVIDRWDGNGATELTLTVTEPVAA